MKLYINIILFILIVMGIMAHGNAIARPVGKILDLAGDVDITQISGTRIIPKEGTIIDSTDKIRTGKKSFISIVLNDGSRLLIREVSVVYIKDIKIKEIDHPTKIEMVTGKLRVVASKVVKGNSIIVYTPTAIAGVRGTDFGVIATQLETRVVVFRGEVEVANRDRNIIKSYVLKDREETRIKSHEPPEEPVVVPDDMLSKWFDSYDIDDKNDVIIKRSQEEGILDKILRKKNF